MNTILQKKHLPKILIIDDNFLFVETLLEFLEENDFQLISAQNGLLGLQLAEAFIPDVILCDIRMPELNGYDVLKKLRQNPSTAKIPFVFISAEQIDRTYLPQKATGANAYLAKPFTISQLIDAIAAQLESN